MIKVVVEGVFDKGMIVSYSDKDKGVAYFGTLHEMTSFRPSLNDR